MFKLNFFQKCCVEQITRKFTVKVKLRITKKYYSTKQYPSYIITIYGQQWNDLLNQKYHTYPIQSTKWSIN